MIKRYNKWTELETNFLIRNYYEGSKHLLMGSLRNRTWSQIKDKARYLKIRRKSRKLSDISILLRDDPISYYWIGFLMADGSFTENRISLGMSYKDMDHLLRYKKFINSNNKIHKMPHDYCQVRSIDASNVRQLKNKFKITNRKTYEPCDLNIQNEELLFSLIMGIIDGDGSISKNKNCEAYTLSISLHPSWLQNLDYIKNFLYDYFNEKCNSKPAFIRERSINLPQDDKSIRKKYKLAEMYISYRPLLIKIKKKAILLKIPFMERKLGIIKI
jgi:hypothetical protein